MARLKRHWRAALVPVLLLMIGSTIIVYRMAERPVAAETPSPAGTAAPALADPEAESRRSLVYSRVQDLRQRLALTSPDLAALGCTREQATGVLEALVAWQERNAAAWERAEQAELAARRELAEATRRVNVGPRDASLIGRLPQLQASLEAATAARTQLADAAGSTILALLLPAQAQRWSTARANRSSPEPYRYASNLTPQQVRSLDVAARKRQPKQLPSQILSASQQAEIRAAQQNVQGHIEGVLAAQEQVLPRPAELAAER